MSSAQNDKAPIEAREWLSSGLIIVLLLAASFMLHLKWCGSDMQLTEQDFVARLQHHNHVYPFSTRPFTTGVIGLMYSAGMSVKTSFFVLQYTLAALLGTLFYALLRSWRISVVRSRLGLFLMLSAYPILAAHIEPVQTWDDLWAHLFAVAAFLAAAYKRSMAAVGMFALAGVAREQSLLYAPALAMALWHASDDRRWRPAVLAVGAGVMVVIVRYLYYWEPLSTERMNQITFNFAHSLRTSDSLFSLFVSFGFLWPAALLGVTRLTDFPQGRLVRFGLVTVVPLTLLAVFFGGHARETRLFFPPFMFVVPSGLALLVSLREVWRKWPRARRVVAAWIGLPAAVMVGYWIAVWLFPEFEYRRCSNFQQEWAGLHIGLIIALATILLVRRRRR